MLKDAVQTKKEVKLEVTTHNLEDTLNNALQDPIHSFVSSVDLKDAIFSALNAGLSEDCDLYHDAGTTLTITCTTTQVPCRQLPGKKTLPAQTFALHMWELMMLTVIWLVGELMESLAEEEREKKYEDAESMFAKKKLEQTQM